MSTYYAGYGSILFSNASGSLVATITLQPNTAGIPGADFTVQVDDSPFSLFCSLLSLQQLATGVAFALQTGNVNLTVSEGISVNVVAGAVTITLPIPSSLGADVVVTLSNADAAGFSAALAHYCVTHSQQTSSELITF